MAMVVFCVDPFAGSVHASLVTDVTHCLRKPQKEGLIMDNVPFTEWLRRM
jgi:hypothetical protein